ncbi:hypothetical protein DB354_07030 [Opitutus sp. ER46]|nr:hypothetical protein DB354_07030 [Opitutus sp. ER46]
MATTTAPTSSGGSAPVSSNAYIEQPQSSVTTVTTPVWGGTYYGGSSGYYGSSHWNTFTPGWGYSSATTWRPRRYFFPPTPPALGESYPRNRTRSASLSLSTIPLELSEHVNEPYYSPLSPFLYEESLSKKRRKMIDDYSAAKTALVDELRAKIESVRALDPAAREAQLADFARQQEPRALEVEKMGYAIRDEFTGWSLFSNSSDWNEARDWRLGDDTRWESNLDEAKLMRGASYFQEGLSPAQRRLLREYAMELDDSGRGPMAEIGLDARGPYLYFSPETSRFRLPASLPAETRTLIANYTKEKSALKKELRDALYREDRRWFGSKRTAAMKALAEAQATRLAALDTMAEEIRRALVAYPLPNRPRAATPAIPQEFRNRLAKFVEDRDGYQRTMNKRRADLAKQFSTSRVEFVKMAGGFGIQLVPSRKLNAEDSAKAQAVVAELASFNAEQIKTYDRLVQEKEAIREALINASGPLAPLVSTRIVDLILADYSRTILVEELWRQYRDYEDAVLLPGLAPAQRRMLYDAALVKLDQQTPSYTY